MRTAPLGVSDTAAWTGLARAAWGPSLLGGGTSSCSTVMRGVVLRVGRGQEALVRERRSALFGSSYFCFATWLIVLSSSALSR